MPRKFKPKLFSLINHQGISKGQILKDVQAGIVVGIVALPLSVAFSVAAGLPPERGLITAIIGGLIIAILGGSRVQIGGPTGAFILITASLVNDYGLNGFFIATILAGIILIILGFLGVGALLKYIPHPLTIGFTCGLAILIFSSQVKDLLGIDLGQTPTSFIGKWRIILTSLDQIDFLIFGVGISTIIFHIITRKLLPKFPTYILPLILVSTIVVIFKLDVPTIGTVFGGIDLNFSLKIPSLEGLYLPDLFSPALTIALLVAIQALLSGVVTDGMFGGNHRSNTEIVAQGIGNVVVPLFGGIPLTGGVARSCINVRSGGRTPVSGIVHSLSLLIIVIILSPFISYIPMASLAGVLVVVSYKMGEWNSLFTVMKASSMDFIVLITTLLLTILVNITTAIEVGVVLSSILFMNRMATSWGLIDLNDSPDDPLEEEIHAPDGVSIYELSGPLFFATIKEYLNVIKGNGEKYNTIIIRMRHVPFIDSTGIHNLKNAIIELNHKNTTVLLSGVKQSVKENLVKNKIIPEDQIFASFTEALDKSRAK